MTKSDCCLKNGEIKFILQLSERFVVAGILPPFLPLVVVLDLLQASLPMGFERANIGQGRRLALKPTRVLVSQH